MEQIQELPWYAVAGAVILVLFIASKIMEVRKRRRERFRDKNPGPKHTNPNHDR